MRKKWILVVALISLAMKADQTSDLLEHCDDASAYRLKAAIINNPEILSKVVSPARMAVYKIIQVRRDALTVRSEMEKNINEGNDVQGSSRSAGIEVLYNKDKRKNPYINITGLEGIERIGSFELRHLTEGQIGEVNMPLKIRYMAEENKVKGLLKYLSGNDYFIFRRHRSRNEKMKGYTELWLQRLEEDRPVINNISIVYYDRKGESLHISSISFGDRSYSKVGEVPVITAEEALARARKEGACTSYYELFDMAKENGNEPVGIGVKEVRPGYMEINNQLLPVYVFYTDNEYLAVPAEK